MNEELIRKLHDQAWGETHEKAIAVTETPIDFQKVLRERFAELIIQDCLAMCLTSVGNKDYNTGRMHCHDNIKEHFGVE